MTFKFFFAKWISRVERVEQKIHFINFFVNDWVHEKFSTAALCDVTISLSRVKIKEV